MPESAFGIEHGEVSKAFSFKPPKMKLPSQTGGAHKAPKPQGFVSSFKSSLTGVQGPGANAGAQRGARAGGNLRRLGQNPNARMGAAAAGGVGAGVGGNRFADRKKRMAQYR